MDIRLYSRTGVYVDYPDISELTKRETADSTTAQGIEVIANKVVKFLLTQKGSDALDPDYGGVALHYGQISESFIPRLTMELQNDIYRCRSFIKETEKFLPDSVEKLKNLVLVKVKYNPRISPDRVDVYIEIITNKENRALVAIPSKG